MSNTSDESVESLLDGEDSEGSFEILSQKYRTSRLRPWLSIAILVVAIGATITAAYIAGASRSLRGDTTRVVQNHNPRWTSCGDNPETARLRGCIFDMITFTWQTAECHDADLNEDFLSYKDWVFYKNETTDETVTKEVAMRGDLLTWVTWEYHVVHCTYTWLQLLKGFEKGWIGNHLHGYKHTRHCQRMLLSEKKHRTPAIINYSSCDRVGSGAGMYPGPGFAS